MTDRPWKLLYTKQGLKDKQTAMENGFREKVLSLTALLKENPYAEYPPCEKLVGNMSGAYSRRLNRQHRLVYRVFDELHTVKIISFWTPYE